MTVLLICYITATWNPPLDWTITEIANQATNAKVTLSRTVKNGEAITVPAGCNTEPSATSGRTIILPHFYGDNMLWRGEVTR